MRRFLAPVTAGILVAMLLLGTTAAVATAAASIFTGFSCSPNGTLPGSPTTTDSRAAIDLANPGSAALQCRFPGAQLPFAIGGPCRFENADLRADFRLRIVQPQRGSSQLACVGATVRLKTDLSITKTDGVDKVQQGATTTYTIVVHNAGPNGVTGATVADTFPAEITAANWTSVAAGGATGNTAAGSGAINDTLDLPVGATVTYSVAADVSRIYTGPLANTATVALPAGYLDTDPTNNTATDTDTVVPRPSLTVRVTYGQDGGQPVFDSIQLAILGFSVTCLQVPEDGNVNCAQGYDLNTVVTVNMTDDAQFLYICPDDPLNMLQSTSSAPFTGQCTVTMDGDKQVFVVGNEQL